MASRLLLLFLLAHALEPSEVGLYGLVVASISYAIFLVGFDFYVYTTRELIKRDTAQWGAVIKNQCALLVVLYLIFLPPLSLIFWFGILPWSVALWCLLLLFVEHFNQELNRLLIAAARPLIASWVLFLRSGFWILALAATSFVGENTLSLLTVFQFWSFGGLIAAALGIWIVALMSVGGWQRDIDWLWIKRGLKVAIPFLLATLSLRGIYTADRYWFEALVNLEVLAAYVLFIGVASALGSFLEAGVFSFEYPALIRSWNEQLPVKFRHKSLRLLIMTLVFCAVFAMIACIFLPYLLGWLAEPIYEQNSVIFPYLMLASVLFSLSMVPHYLLYAQGHDRAIIYSHVTAFICFLLATWMLSDWDELLAVPVALGVSFAALLVWKTMAYLSLTPANYNIIFGEG